MTRVQEVRKKFEEPKSSSEVLIFLKKPLWYWPLDFLISFFFLLFFSERSVLLYKQSF